MICPTEGFEGLYEESIRIFMSGDISCIVLILGRLLVFFADAAKVSVSYDSASYPPSCNSSISSVTAFFAFGVNLTLMVKGTSLFSKDSLTSNMPFLTSWLKVLFCILFAFSSSDALEAFRIILFLLIFSMVNGSPTVVA